MITSLVESRALHRPYSTDCNPTRVIRHTTRPHEMAACCYSYSIVAIIVTNSMVHCVYPYEVFPNHRYYGNKDHSYHTGGKTIKRLEEQPRYYKTVQIGHRPENSLKESPFTHLRHEAETKNKNKSFENFVTTKDDIFPEKRYEVTTENMEEAEKLSAVGVDNDVAIALDDVEEEEEDPEETNTLDPQEYFESYGRLHQNHQGRSHHGHPDGSYSYGVVHTQPNHYHRQTWRPTGRVRIKVFYGPTRSVGHHRYAQWGYYVIQPTEHQSYNHRDY